MLEYLTKACVSGMSPGGLTSGATAVSVEEIGVSVPVVVVVEEAVVASVCESVLESFALHAAVPVDHFSGTDENLFGVSQPRRAHVPPNGLESTTTTLRPASLLRLATADAADPDPITMTSNRRVIVSP